MSEQKQRVEIKCRANEREAFMRLNLCGILMTDIAETFKNRSQYVKYGKRDLGLMQSLISRIMAEFVDTVPQSQINTLVHNIHGTGYTIGAKMPTSKTSQDLKNFGLWISFEDLNTILQALKDKCMFCDLDEQHEKSCPLRKALDNLCNDVDHTAGRCGYRDKFE